MRPFVRHEFDLAMPLSALLRLAPGGGVPGWFADAPSLHFCESGRTAVRAAAEALGLGRGAEVLVPGYNCGSEIDALVSTGAGVRLVPVGPNLALDPGTVGRAIGPATRALHLIHYFGAPQPALAELAALCRQRGLALIEDCAVSPFSLSQGRPLGSVGDAAIYSLAKTLPVPSGGVLRLARPPVADPFPRPARLARVWRGLARAGIAAVLGDRATARLVELARTRGLTEPPTPTMMSETGGEAPDAYRFLPGMRGRGIDPLSRRALSGMDPGAVVSRRRRNHARLAGLLEGAPGLAPAGPAMPEDACAHALLIRLPARGRFLAACARRGVTLYQRWGHAHPAVDWTEAGGGLALKAEGVTLPVHQALTDADIDHLAAVVRSAAAEVASDGAGHAS